ncbi:MAG: hypothetical protein NZM12_12700 [Steroidobacteraceae bacterium]|nr:hypothetical protein [Steroidobacteraceae bacterium]MDW8260053.1 hypothetical protein [Gammaproteobacteria bacterium]
MGFDIASAAAAVERNPAARRLRLYCVDRRNRFDRNGAIRAVHVLRRLTKLGTVARRIADKRVCPYKRLETDTKDNDGIHTD